LILKLPVIKELQGDYKTSTGNIGEQELKREILQNMSQHT